jgi:hypothetical protein
MRKPLAILSAVFLVALSAAAAVGMANIYRSEADSLAGEWFWTEDGEGPPAWAWEQVHRYLWLANRLAPFDPQILDDLGQLYEFRAGEARANDSNADLDRALEYYWQSLALRPFWPYAWANIVGHKISQERIDAEFGYAIQRALVLGPWQTSVQASIAGGGLAVWDKLPATLQMGVEHTVARGLAHDSRLMHAVARRFGLLATQ